MAAGAGLGVAGLAGVAFAPTEGVAGAYLSFLSAIGVWAFAEIAFLLGLVTGARRTPCPTGLEGPPRFFAAAQTVLHHELLLAALGLGVAGLVWAGANPVALWTFLALWLMRLSTKLNIFLGVPNAAEDLLPQHLAYLESYFGPRRVNAFFPLFVTLATLATLLVAQAAWHASETGAPVTGLCWSRP